MNARILFSFFLLSGVFYSCSRDYVPATTHVADIKNGEANFKFHCQNCHNQNDVVADINWQAEKIEKSFNGAHGFTGSTNMQYTVAEISQRELIDIHAYLKQAVVNGLIVSSPVH